VSYPQPDNAVSAGGAPNGENHCMRDNETNRGFADMPNQGSYDVVQTEAINSFDGRGGMAYCKFFHLECRFGRLPFDLLTEEVNCVDNQRLEG
jgi:hypothetical protein